MDYTPTELYPNYSEVRYAQSFEDALLQEKARQVYREYTEAHGTDIADVDIMAMDALVVSEEGTTDLFTEEEQAAALDYVYETYLSVDIEDLLVNMTDAEYFEFQAVISYLVQEVLSRMTLTDV